MIPLQVEGKTYLLEFKHRKRLGKRAELYAKAPLNGVTTCAILGTDEQNRPFVAIGTSICVREDNFSRPFGRANAFVDAVAKCGMLRAVEAPLVKTFAERFPDRRAVIKTSTPLSEDERNTLKERGREIRERRQAAKQGTASQGA